MNYTRTKYYIVLLSIICLCLPILGKSIAKSDVDLIKRTNKRSAAEDGDDVETVVTESTEIENEDNPGPLELEDLCADGKEGVVTCNKEHKECISTPDEQNKYKCEGCLEGFDEDSDGNCFNLCTDGQTGFTACEEQKKTCVLTKDITGFKCDKCLKGLVENKENECVEDLCADGKEGLATCNKEHKKCISTPDEEKQYKCDGCLEGFDGDTDGNCVDLCTEGKTGNLTCTAKHMKCDADPDNSPFYNCGDCLNGFSLAGIECVNHCNKTKPGDLKCSRAKRVCKPTAEEPYYFECGECLDKLVDNGTTCFDPCSKGHIGDIQCKQEHRKCEFDIAKNYTCGECEDGPFIEAEGACVDGCAIIAKEDKTWEQLCGTVEKTSGCKQNKNKTAVTCHCDDEAHLFNLEKETCSAPCDEENGLGYSECNTLQRECVDTGKGTYQCGDCTDKKLIVHENVCVDPCAEDKPGYVDCRNTNNRLCESDETKEEKYRCGGCIENHIVDKDDKCIDPCEEIAKDGKTWSQQCKDTNGLCILNDDKSGATCRCEKSGEIFDIRNKECNVPCEHIYKDGSNDTWTKICNDANADCTNDLPKKKGICKCNEENRAFDENKFECFDPCANGTEAFTLCENQMRDCLFKEDGHNFAECGSCIDGYHEKGGNCVEIDPCESDPCQNEGTCTRIDRDNYKCECTEYWYGDNCEHKEWCKHGNPCDPETCKIDKDHHTYTCICEGDLYYDHIDKSCKGLSKCIGITCNRYEQCVDEIGNCTCVEGFNKPEGEEDCKLTTEQCKKYCGENAKCNIASNFIDVECSCEDGYYLDPASSKCETLKCVTLFHPCEQLCKIEGGNETCSCHSGFDLKSDGKTCERKKDNECKVLQCANGVCVKEDDKEECTCNKGYFKGTDGSCVDICSSENDPHAKKYCPDGCLRDEKGEIKCNCTGTYVQAEDGVLCKRKNVCEKGEEGEKECSSLNANCRVLRQEPWYNCECPPHLLDIAGNCSDSCRSEMVNECAKTMRTCELRKSTSTNELEEACVCQLSMVYDSVNNKCHFDKNSFFVTFELKSPIFQNKMSQAPPNVNMNSIYEAMKTIYGESLKGFEMVECSFKDENVECTVMLTLTVDSENIRRRIKVNDTCKDLDGDKEYCILPPKLVVLRASLNNNKLTKDVCNENLRDKYCPTVSNDCINEEPGYNCLCKEGFKPVTTFILGGQDNYKYDVCEDVDECVDENRCWENSKCENTVGSFRCVCNKNHFLTESKDKCQDYCKPSPCKNNGECIYTESSFQCECSKGYTGGLCEKNDEFLQKANTNMIVIGAVLGSVLLISFIIIIVLIGKVKKRSNEENEYDAQLDDYGRSFGNGKGLGDRERAVRRERLGKQGYDNPAM